MPLTVAHIAECRETDPLVSSNDTFANLVEHAKVDTNGGALLAFRMLLTVTVSPEVALFTTVLNE